MCVCTPCACLYADKSAGEGEDHERGELYVRDIAGVYVCVWRSDCGERSRGEQECVPIREGDRVAVLVSRVSLGDDPRDRGDVCVCVCLCVSVNLYLCLSVCMHVYVCVCEPSQSW